MVNVGSAAVTLFLFAFAIRVRGIDQHLWLLGDQIRDWGIALRPLHELPLVGPVTHVSQLRGIRTEFELPPSTDPEFLYRIFGGRIDADAPNAALIGRDGAASYVGAALRSD